ncbi:MAG TPA: CBS domain-containing protein [Terriglobales bacterium]|nr:CBS domain-containing protein [Terriglobales bacterium]
MKKKKDGTPLPPEPTRPASDSCVGDYMTRNVTTLTDQSRLLDAALLIRRTGKRHVPIVDEAGRAVGIISDRDVSRMAPSMLSRMTPDEYNQIFEATPITVAMTKNPITVRPDLPIRDAVTMLYQKKIGAIIVTENDQVVGILTVTDMLALLNALLSEGKSSSATA